MHHILNRVQLPEFEDNVSVYQNASYRVYVVPIINKDKKVYRLSIYKLVKGDIEDSYGEQHVNDHVISDVGSNYVMTENVIINDKELSYIIWTVPDHEILDVVDLTLYAVDMDANYWKFPNFIDLITGMRNIKILITLEDFQKQTNRNKRRKHLRVVK